jgi:hypothetical protein
VLVVVKRLNLATKDEVANLKAEVMNLKAKFEELSSKLGSGPGA